jgi:6,7-dimethyl-8-ribityllumazine synthase
MPRTARKQSLPRRAADKPRVGVVVSRYNASVTDELMEGAATAYANRCGDTDGVVFVPAAGAFEITVLSAELAASGRFEAIVALGCIIKGETSHDQHLARAVTDGLARIALDYRIPIGLGVLTVNNGKQARDRAGGKLGNKGEEAMHAALDTLAAIRAIRSGAGRGGDSSPARAVPDKAASRNGKLIRGTRGGKH